MVLVRSDQGSQFTSMDWAVFLKHHSLEHSMSRGGNCHGNAMAESFFTLLEREHLRDGCGHPWSSKGSRKCNPRMSTKLGAIQQASKKEAR